MSIAIGIIGFAHGHVNMYCNQWREHPELGVHLVAGWDHDPARLQAAVESYGVAGFDDIDALLSDPGIRGVVIAAETSLHAELVEKAAAAGKAIVLQKPLALTIAEADRIVDAVQRHGVPFTLAWQMRVDPQNIQIKSLLESGSLGRVFMVRRRHSLSTHLWANFADTWHADPKLNRDIFADDSSHAIDFLLWLLGKPESVTAELVTLCDSRVPNDNGIAVFRYKDGPLAEVVGSYVSPAGENTVEVTAESGNIIQNYGDAPSCAAPRPPDSPGLKWYSAETKAWTISAIASPRAHAARISGLADPLAQFLNGHRSPLATAEEGRTALRMTLACYVSSQEGRRVHIDDPAIDLV